MSKRPKSQLQADESYRQKNIGVLVRYSPDELKLIDAVRGKMSRAEWIKARSMAGVSHKAR